MDSYSSDNPTDPNDPIDPRDPKDLNDPLDQDPSQHLDQSLDEMMADLSDQEMELLLDYIEGDVSESASSQFKAFQDIMDRKPDLEPLVEQMMADKQKLQALPVATIPIPGELIQTSLEMPMLTLAESKPSLSDDHNSHQTHNRTRNKLSFNAFLAYSSIAALVAFVAMALFVTFKASLETVNNTNQLATKINEQEVQNESGLVPASPQEFKIAKEKFGDANSLSKDQALKRLENKGLKSDQFQSGSIQLEAHALSKMEMSDTPLTVKQKRPVALTADRDSQVDMKKQGGKDPQPDLALDLSAVLPGQLGQLGQPALKDGKINQDWQKVALHQVRQVAWDANDNYAALVPAHDILLTSQSLEEDDMEKFEAFEITQNNMADEGLASTTQAKPQYDITVTSLSLDQTRNAMGGWLAMNNINANYSSDSSDLAPSRELALRMDEGPAENGPVAVSKRRMSSARKSRNTAAKPKSRTRTAATSPAAASTPAPESTYKQATKTPTESAGKMKPQDKALKKTISNTFADSNHSADQSQQPQLSYRLKLAESQMTDLIAYLKTTEVTFSNRLDSLVANDQELDKSNFYAFTGTKTLSDKSDKTDPGNEPVIASAAEEHAENIAGGRAGFDSSLRSARAIVPGASTPKNSQGRQGRYVDNLEGKTSSFGAATQLSANNASPAFGVNDLPQSLRHPWKAVLNEQLELPRNTRLKSQPLDVRITLQQLK